MAAAPKPPPARHDDPSASINDVVRTFVDYAKQETLGPLRGAGRWLAFGTVGAALIGLGSALFMLGLLRLLQTEWTRSATGSLSWLSYLIVVVIGSLGVALAVSRIRKSRLYPPAKEESR